MGSPSKHRWVAGLLLLSMLLVTSGCGGQAESPNAEPDQLEGIARTVADEPAATAEAETPSVLDDPSVNPEGVINAAVLLHSGGDVDAAFAAGAFSRADLDAARAGLADGSLDYLFD